VKPLRYEVDLAMLPDGAVAGDVGPFCRVLEQVMEEDGDDLVRIVETFRAFNDPTDGRLACWGWPTVPQWDRAVARYFGVVSFPYDAERDYRVRRARPRV